MGSHQRFQRFTVRRQNNHRIGGQPGHRNFPSQLPIRHATAPPIRLLFCCRKAASLTLPSYLHARRSRNFRSAVLALKCGCAVGALIMTTAAASAADDDAKKFSTATPIKHLVVIFQENVSFDHYFGTYPVAKNTDGTPFTAAPSTPTSINTLTNP